MKTGTGKALVADYERKAIAGRAPYFHTLKGVVKSQGHMPTVHLLGTCAFVILN